MPQLVKIASGGVVVQPESRMGVWSENRKRG